LLYRPLYWFGKNGVSTINYRLSLARAPIYSNHGRTVTIHLDHYRWSDGTPLTSRDVEFWMNELDAEKANWYGYVPGGFPDNLTRAAYPNASTVVLTFAHAYNPVWLLYNELSQITPIPQHAWDRTSARGLVGNHDRSRSGAAAVYAFLDTESKTLHTYTTNPLWKVVDGPWRLSAYDPTTQAMTLVPNRAYSGPDKPRIAAIEDIPFTSYAAEFDALRGGQLDYGYLPPPDYGQAAYFRAHGYRIQSWPLWATAYAVYNFTNPKAGPIFEQLYFRQAIQHLVDQPQDVRSVWHGFAVPTYGPVPISPTSQYLTKAEEVNPYPYSVAAARTLLRSHGWRKSGGRLRCAAPGSGRDE
ncbi:MAG: ABC transporter substrate-binding protein, partial [Streptosporangiaceae bacterium]